MIHKSPIRILAVEDDPQDFVLLKDTTLEQDNNEFDFVHAISLKQAFTELEQNDFDLILLDLGLPDTTGTDAISQVNAKRPKTPLVVLTGLDDRDTGLTAVRKGAQDFLIKGKIDGEGFAKTVYYAIERVRLENFRDDIVNNISHELRTPLTIIQESISQMAEGIMGDTTEKQDKYLKKCLGSIERLRSIIDGLLDISKLEEGKFNLVKEKVDVNELMNEVIFNFSLKAQENDIDLRNKTNVCCQALADPDRVIQVLTNLVGNALKFTDQGFIEISAQEQGDWIACSIRDTGKGIAPKDMHLLFSKFDQIGRISGPGERGTGLGLPISKGIVELHGGEMQVQSIEGEGTTFTFSLPKYDMDKHPAEELNHLISSSIEQYNQFSLIKLTLKDKDIIIKQKGQALLQEIFSKLKDEIKGNLYRRLDQVLASPDAVYLLLPNTEKEQTPIVVERIQRSINEADWEDIIDENFLKQHQGLSLKAQAASFPLDGLTQEDLMTKLTSVQGSIL